MQIRKRLTESNDINTSSETLSGIVHRVTFHNEQNGFCVLSFKVNRTLINLIGHMPSISEGESLQAKGVWINDPIYGRQFRANFIKSVQPSTEEGVERYLASGMIRGIGQFYAKRLICSFGSEVFNVIENEPERLSDVSGLGPKRIASILMSWKEQKAVREIMTFLYGHGVGTARATRIFKTYGNNAVQIISDDPYRLARDIRGIGFVTADAIAMNMGMEKTSLARARAGVSYALEQALHAGHCGLPRRDLLSSTAKLLDIPEDLIDNAITLEIGAGVVVADDIEGRNCIFLSELYRSEVSVSERISVLAGGSLPWSVCDCSRDISIAEKQIGFCFSDGQKTAICKVLASKVSVITGGPGVGKTTIINAILKVLESKGVKILLCGPTGRAAKRMSEATGCEARTIHRLLEFDPQTFRFRHGAENKLHCGLLVIDETSMVDVSLMSMLLQAIPDCASVIFVGDVDQLPSVGPGQVLADIIASGVIPVVRLTEVFRQAAESQIIANAHRINVGLLPEFESQQTLGDFYFISIQESEMAIATLLEVVQTRIPARFGFDPVRDIQVLCPMYRGGLGAHSLNIELQKLLNADGAPRIERFGYVFAVGDKVMQIENAYDKEVYNGDIGFIRDINKDTGEMLIDFGGRDVAYGFGELDQITLAYATTIHKSQGSEYPVVVMPVTTQHYAMLRRNLLYTGVTRAKKLLILIGQKKALAIAVKNAADHRRWSKLRELLADCDDRL